MQLRSVQRWATGQIKSALALVRIVNLVTTATLWLYPIYCLGSYFAFNSYLQSKLSLPKPTFFESVIFEFSLYISRQILLTRQAIESRNRTLYSFEHREDAYDEIVKRLEELPEIREVWLLQFSGTTAMPLLRAILKKSPRAKIHLKIASIELGAQYDEHDFHKTRIECTQGQIELWREEMKDLDLTIQSTSDLPSVAGVVIDDAVVSVGWYHVQKGNGVKTLRGHVSPAFVAFGKSTKELRSFIIGLEEQTSSSKA